MKRFWRASVPHTAALLTAYDNETFTVFEYSKIVIFEHTQTIIRKITNTEAL